MIHTFLISLLGCAGTPQPPAVEVPEDPYTSDYHFQPPAGWMNDPNGLVYHQGEWHLFYQHYPDSTVWGPMHWGHAVSPDLFDWEDLPIALYPDSLGYIFSGSAVVDRGNSSGFGTESDPALVAMYTYHDPVGERAERDDFQYQGIAYSNDRGRNWTKYAGNPVIPNPGVRDFRDPKVVRDEANDQWVMVLAAQDRVKFYGSNDLKAWRPLSEFGPTWNESPGVWECPELIPFELDGERIWLLVVSINPGGAHGGSGSFYIPGYWDGTNFSARRQASYSPSDTINWVDYGRDNYAGVTFDNAPDGRRVFLGWMSNWDYAQVVPATTRRSAMTVPRALQLVSTYDFGVRLHQQPVEELKALRSTRIDLSGSLPSGITEIAVDSFGGSFEVDITVDLVASEATSIYLTLENEAGEFYRCGYERGPGNNYYFSDRSRAGRSNFSDKFAGPQVRAPRWTNSAEMRLHALFDRNSAELFWDDGEPVMTDIFFPSVPFTRAVLEANGPVSLVSGKVWNLNAP